jgi:hypothetical protein
MVQEYRKIMFSPDEVRLALDVYRRIVPNFIPQGCIKECSIYGHGVIKVDIEPVGANKHKPICRTLQVEELLKPIIALCIENKIMLPRAGHKAVAVSRGSIILCIDLRVQLAGAEESVSEKEQPAQPVSLSPHTQPAMA